MNHMNQNWPEPGPYVGRMRMSGTILLPVIGNITKSPDSQSEDNHLGFKKAKIITERLMTC